MRNLTRWAASLLVMAGALAPHASAQTITTVPPGLNAGDTYRIIFVTRAQTTATSTDIAFYNGFVSSVAQSAPALAALNTTWKALASTAAVNALANTGLGNPEKFYNTRGELYAVNTTGGSYSGALFAGVNTFRTPSIDILDETGAGGSLVFTGTGYSGQTFRPLGGYRPAIGIAFNDTNPWIYASFHSDCPFGTCVTQASIYGVSGVLTVPSANEAPVAAAGAGQSIHAGSTVYLDGSASYDDNTASAELTYTWRFVSTPVGSSAALTQAGTATPSFVADTTGTFVIGLTVTDEGGLDSPEDQVVVSSSNQAPTADAGADQMVVVFSIVTIDGSGSTDPDSDALSFGWTIVGPAGSSAVLNGADTATPNFQPDLPGTYTVTLTASDFLGAGTPDTVEVTAITAAAFAEQTLLGVDELLVGLSAGQVTTVGNQNAFGNFLRNAVKSLQKGDAEKAVDSLNEAITRTDGCERTGAPDGNGSGRDWITDCAAQEQMLADLRAARDALIP
jgi:PKD domain